MICVTVIFLHLNILQVVMCIVPFQFRFIHRDIFSYHIFVMNNSITI